MLHIKLVTLFPELFSEYLQTSIVGRAIKRNLLTVSIYNPRDYSSDSHRAVDDRPYGGGAGMVMTPEPLFRAVDAANSDGPTAKSEACSRVLMMSPQGSIFTQKMAKELAQEPLLIIVCGHYSGVDERFISYAVDSEISIGDYVLTGGELPALVVLDSITRLLPNALGNAAATEQDSFWQPGETMLQGPLYTRPASYRGWSVPAVLRSGNYSAITKWRNMVRYNRTARRARNAHNQ